MITRLKYETELKTVCNKLIEMCRMSEIAIETTIRAVSVFDIDAMHKVIADDSKIDIIEREIEQDCLKILLLEHPVAGDFRDVSAALKMITDLERIGDQAADICELCCHFKEGKLPTMPEHITLMAKIATSMVKDSVQCYVNRDLESARQMNVRDDRVDELFVKVKNELIDLIRENPNNADGAILMLMIAKYFERIGDHAVNIGEWVEYAVTGIRINNG